MDILTWLIVGLVAGALASFVIGGVGYGLVGDIIVGIAGAFIGAFVFREAGWRSPFTGIGGTIFIAFVGAALLLATIRLVRGNRRRRDD